MTETVNALIVDDEENSRMVLKSLLEDYCPQVKVLATAESAPEGIAAIATHAPELVFLDIRMPSADEGFQLLESLDDINFAVIFTTSFDEYAIRAIKFSALDYLLKPINILELQKAVNRYIKRRGAHDGQGIRNLPDFADNFQKLGLPGMDGLTFVKVDDIIRCEADGNCTVFYLQNGKKTMVTRTLKYYDELLSESNFFRIHGSHLINLKHIVRYLKEGTVFLSNGSHVFVSARKKKAFLERLKQLDFRI